MMDEKELLEEQKAYYRARAPEYDHWFQRRGRYAEGPDAHRQWSLEVEEVRRALGAFNPSGKVLELASGTGWWTQELLRYADLVTALDSSSEALDLNRARLGGDRRIDYTQADIFAWEPGDQFDVIFFSFWPSHVPRGRFAQFWGLVRATLRPAGKVFFIDSLRSSSLRPFPKETAGSGDPVSVRKLSDGSEFRVVKIFHEPRELQSDLNSLGWIAAIRRTENFFLYGTAEPDRG